MTRLRYVWALVAALAALLGVAGATTAYLRSTALQRELERYVVARWEQASGTRLEIAAFHFELRPLRLELDGVVVRGREGADQPPLATIPHIEADLRLVSLLHRDLRLDQLVIERPRFHLEAQADRQLNLPSPPARAHFAVQMRRLVVEGGELDYENRRLPLDLRLSDVGAQWQGDGAALRGEIRAGGMRLAYAGWPALQASADLRLRLAPDGARVEQLLVRTTGAQLEAQGWLRHWSQPDFTGTYQLQADGRVLRGLGIKTDLAAATVQATGSLRWSQAAWEATGTASLADARAVAPAAALGRWSGQADYQAGADGLVISRLQLDGAGGQILLHGDYSHWNALTLAGSVWGIAGDALAPALRLAGAPAGFSQALAGASATLAARLQGTVRVAARRDQPADNEIAAQLKITPSRAERGRTPLTGELQAHYWPAQNRVDFDSLALALAGNTLQASGTLSAEQVSLRLAIASADLASLRGLDLLRAWAPALPRLDGGGGFQGQLTGRLRAPTLSGNLQLTQFRDEAHPAWGVLGLAADGSLGPEALRLAQAHLSQGQQRLDGSGTLALDRYRIVPSSRLQLQLQAEHLSLAQAQAWAGLHYAVTGTLGARLTLSGTWTQPQGDGQFALQQIQWKTQTARSITASFHLRQGQLTSSDFTVALARTRIAGQLQLGLRDHSYRIDASSPGVQLSDLAILQSQRLTLGGQVRFQLTGSGSWERPQASLILTTRNLRGGGESLGDVGARLELQPDGVQFQAADILPDGSFNLTGSVGLAKPYPLQARVQLRDYDFDPWLRRFTPAQVSGHSRVSGTAVLAGPLAQPDRISAQIALDPLELAVSGLRLRNQSPVRLSASPGGVTLAPAHFLAQDSDFTLRGQAKLGATLGAPIGLDAALNGEINLALLDSFFPATRATGQVTVATQIGGTLAQPQLAGEVEIHNASLSEADLPIAFDSIQGQLRLSGRRVDIEQLTAHTGSGSVALGGYAARRDGRMDFDVNARGENLRLRYQGISASGDLQLRLRPGEAPGSARLAGTIELNRVGLDPTFDLALFLASSASSPNSPDTNALLSRIQLDLHLVTGPQLEVTTSLARLQMQAELQLQGTLADPLLLGRASAGEGRLLFAGNEYSLTKAQVQFVPQYRNDPLLDIGLSTTVQQYDITLNVAGPADHLAITYRSDPPLASSDVVALLATGEPTAATASLNPAAPGGAGAGSDQLLGQALNNVVSGRMQRLFGVTQVQVNADNGLLATTGSSGTVTVEQQVAHNLKLTYTQNLSSSSQDIIQIEWTISRALGIELNRDQFGLYGLSFTFRQRKQ